MGPQPALAHSSLEYTSVTIPAKDHHGKDGTPVARGALQMGSYRYSSARTIQSTLPVDKDTDGCSVYSGPGGGSEEWSLCARVQLLLQSRTRPVSPSMDCVVIETLGGYD
eukprot:5000306-Amphidinium_carterae.1